MIRVFGMHNYKRMVSVLIALTNNYIAVFVLIGIYRGLVRNYTIIFVWLI